MLLLPETKNEITLKRGLRQMKFGNKDFKQAILNTVFSVTGSPICTVKASSA